MIRNPMGGLSGLSAPEWRGCRALKFDDGDDNFRRIGLKAGGGPGRWECSVNTCDMR